MSNKYRYNIATILSGTIMASLITYTNLPTANGDHLGSIEKDKAIDYRNWYENRNRDNTNNDYYQEQDDSFGESND